MISPFERFVVLRYLKGAHGRSEGKRFLQFITYVAIGGVAVGVAALLLALSVVRGFSEEIEDKIIGFGAHVQVERFQDTPIENADQLEAELSNMPHVTQVSPIVQEFVLLRHTSRHIEGVSLWGTAAPPGYLREHVIAGSFSYAADSAGRQGAVLGSELARLLDVEVGDLVTAFSTRNREGQTSAGFRPRAKQFHVAGIFETYLSDFDAVYVFTDITAARALLDYPAESVSRFNVQLSDPKRAAQVTRTIEKQVGFPYISRTIYEVFYGLFAWIRLQESIIPLVIGVIILVAAFNIVGTLLTIMLEKTRELGVLAGMGASPKLLKRLFMWLGTGIGCVGVVIGSGLALALALLQMEFGLLRLPASAYFIETAPVALRIYDFFIVGALAILLCVLAAYIPARVASRIDPIRIIRFR